ncbi:nuclear transport factor 2 family protein [Flexithrix dorotheae]|uniref:nuclear transport factor 2 family protein n=1 Tax=Flexithrix dorotheae TaxID=70993 RepID=UPI0003805D5F|nr:nuclear transport factor 2 family protein [Flexithrix dorotheae]
MENKQLIEEFYTAFQKLDAERMTACYHENIQFEDPAFGTLKGEQVGNMWRMLIERSEGNLEITFHDVEASETTGKAHWEAKYLFSKTNRKVHNKIKASFQFKDGKIYRHTDYFNFWKWSGMALGPIGYFLGFTPLVKNKVRKTSLHLLAKYSGKKFN